VVKGEEKEEEEEEEEEMAEGCDTGTLPPPVMTLSWVLPRHPGRLKPLNCGTSLDYLVKANPAPMSPLPKLTVVSKGIGGMVFKMK